jgi:hypothetical protein
MEARKEARDVETEGSSDLTGSAFPFPFDLAFEGDGVSGTEGVMRE